MSRKPKVLVLRTAGTNCDQETAFAFQSSGADADLVHVNQFFSKQFILRDYHILALPGGFTYGDDIESGRILANELRLNLGKEIDRFIKDGKLIIGICNGFQILVKTAYLPGKLSNNDKTDQTVTLTNNNSGKFEDRWTYLKVDGDSPWTKDLGKIVYFPVAHAQGKFIVRNKSILNKLKQNDQIAFRYTSTNGRSSVYPENPNGSIDDIAGITDRTGRILGLMPHPERHFFFTQHPFWTRSKKRARFGDGAKIFKNGVNYVKENLLGK